MGDNEGAYLNLSRFFSLQSLMKYSVLPTIFYLKVRTDYGET